MAVIPIARPLRLASILGIMVVVVACAGARPAWTYVPATAAPPTTATQPASAPPSTADPSGAASGGGSVTIEIRTTDADPLAFDPQDVSVPAGAQVTVRYTNDTAIPHNIHFFDGPDQDSRSLGKTPIVTGPGAVESMTFDAPTTPGEYFFWCDVHQLAMTGHYHVQ